MITFAHIAIFCNDLDKMEKFYQDVFSMKTVWKNANDKAYLTTGNSDIFALLRKASHRNKEYDLDELAKDPHVTPNFPHFGVVVDSQEEFDKLTEKVKLLNIKFVGPKISRDTTKSFYFFDPENNPVQVVNPPREYFTR